MVRRLICRLSEDAVIADSGAYSFGMAYCDVPDIKGQSVSPLLKVAEANDQLGRIPPSCHLSIVVPRRRTRSYSSQIVR